MKSDNGTSGGRGEGGLKSIFPSSEDNCINDDQLDNYGNKHSLQTKEV